MKRKNIIAVTLCAAVVLSLGACQNKGKEAEEKDISVMEKDGTDISGDYREADTFDIQSTE